MVDKLTNTVQVLKDVLKVGFFFFQTPDQTLCQCCLSDIKVVME